MRLHACTYACTAPRTETAAVNARSLLAGTVNLSDALQKRTFTATAPDYRILIEGINLALQCRNASCRLSKVGEHWAPIGFGVEVDLMKQSYACKECASPSAAKLAGFYRCLSKWTLRIGEHDAVSEHPSSDVADKSPAGTGFDEMELADFIKKCGPSILKVVCTAVTTPSEVEQVVRQAEQSVKHAVLALEVANKYVAEQDKRALENDKEIREVIDANPNLDIILARVEEAAEDPEQKAAVTQEVDDAKKKVLATKERLRQIKQKSEKEKADAEERRKALEAEASMLRAKKQVRNQCLPEFIVLSSFLRGAHHAHVPIHVCVLIWTDVMLAFNNAHFNDVGESKLALYLAC
jgi:hypothetical protein